MQSINIRGRLVGDGSPCLVVAEAGVNHNGDLDIAHAIVDSAADAGADAVKFQNFRAEEFIGDPNLSYAYESQGVEVRETQLEMFKRLEMQPGWLRQLRDHAMQRGVIFFSTPSGFDSLRELVDLEIPLLKNGSDALTHVPLIRAMAQSGIPTVLSTGMSTESEIRDSVDAFRAAGGAALVLLHCVSSYPAPPAEANLRRIPSMRRLFSCPVGFSDHTDGTVTAVAAVVMGACLIEKHFSLDRGMAGPDHRFSADPRQLRALVDDIRLAESSLGDEKLGPTSSEAMGRAEYRLSCVAARDLAAGWVLTNQDIGYRRPGSGIPPADAVQLVGARLREPLRAGEQIRPENIH